MSNVLLGCFTCRLRRKKCDEGKPKCKACRHLGLSCEYKRPMWWSNAEMRKQQKEIIKNSIKRTKVTDKTSTLPGQNINSPPGLSHSVPTSDTYSDIMGRGTRAASEESQYSLEYDFNQFPDSYDPYAQQLHTPGFGHTQMYHHYPYEVDVKTERQMYVNDYPTRRDSTISTFSTFHPPPHGALPAFPTEEWIQEDFYERHDSWSGEENFDSNYFDFSHGIPDSKAQTPLAIDENDQSLLDHFIENVLRLIFPILEVNQHGSVKTDVILPALQTNKCYLHCCLSISAIHKKSTQQLQSDQLDNDIVKHRYEAVSELCKALSLDRDHLQILEAALGMIFFQCSVGRPDDALPDIPWHQHFQAAISLVNRLDLPRVMEEMPHTGTHPPFNMTLTAWIDILGSTMLGRTPQFASTYRTKHLTGSSSGLCELMGCDDRVMYLLSEIACLDSLKKDGRVDDLQVCTHITALAQQLDATENPGESPSQPFSANGAIRPKQLARNMTALFRIAARIYLCSLVPDFNRYQQSMVNLISRFADLLQYVPGGPDGFDRSLVWPLLICGSYSIPTSSFRRVLKDRIYDLGEQAEFGSFGKMVHVLHEVWRRSDEINMNSSATCTPTPTSATTPGGETTGMKCQNVHWRDVMQQNGMDVLLI
ncbi:MAG: hypothetical protein Q9227_004168 [Pyrenula ochraceoflavens]